MRYYLIAGEPSGDLHGANLMKGLKAHDPEAKFRFWGGDKMAGVGGSGNLAKHYKETSFFGIVEVIKNLRTIRRQMKECRQDVEAFAPDVLILVDYPGFNMKMARWAKEHGIRVFYYIAPKVWAWREWRVKAIRKYVDELAGESLIEFTGRRPLRFRASGALRTRIQAKREWGME